MRYNPALDGLRAVAVLMVIEYHGYWHTLGLQGARGVDVFFVLSGFLITTILLREEADGGIRLGAFYLRRARRLYPALCVLVLAVVGAGWISIGEAVGPLLYLNDYLGSPGELGHTWTLTVEERYYLLWPLALGPLSRMRRRNAILIVLAAYVGVAVWTSGVLGPSQPSIRFELRMSGLLCGSLLAFLPRTTLLPFIAAIGAYVALAAGWDAERTFTEMITACVILLSYETKLPFLTRAPLVYLGRISYGMYLYHWPIQGLLHRWSEGWQLLLLTIAATVACASVSYHTIEAWFRYPKPKPLPSPSDQLA